MCTGIVEALSALSNVHVSDSAKADRAGRLKPGASQASLRLAVLIPIAMWQEPET